MNAFLSSPVTGFGVGLILGCVGVLLIGWELHKERQRTTYWQQEAAKAADEANDLHGRNVALDRDILMLEADLLDARGRLHDAETGAGLSAAQSDAVDAHWRGMVRESELRAFGAVYRFPNQRGAGDAS